MAEDKIIMLSELIADKAQKEKIEAAMRRVKDSKKNNETN